MGAAAPSSPAIPIIRRISAGSARRAPRSARRSGSTTRLLHPMARQSDGTLARLSWDDALDQVAHGFARTIAQHGPDSVAFYLSGQLLTEDYYVANKLMKGFLGSANVDTNSRLCMASSVAGHRRAFGADTVPGTYRDLDEADLIVLVGSNAAWCHPVLYQRMVANKRARGAKIVVIDPRRTATVEDADLFLPVAPGMDTRAVLRAAGASRREPRARLRLYRRAHLRHRRGAGARARNRARCRRRPPPRPGLRRADVARFFALFRSHREGRHLLLARREPVGAGHRQGQRHRQLPSRHRPHRQAGLRPVLAHRPAQCHGRARGRRAGQSARRTHELRARARRPRRALLERADMSPRTKA